MKKLIEKIQGKNIIGTIFEITKMSGGIVNQTFKVWSSQGYFVLQNITNTKYGMRSAMDYKQIENELYKSRLHIPRLISYWQDEDGFWKITEYIEHWKKSFPDDNTSASAALYLGMIHNALKGARFVPQASIPGFHDSLAIFNRLEKFLAGDIDQSVRKAAKFIMERGRSFSIPNEPRQLIHGDTKFQNFLFDENDGFVSLIDWETAMIGNPLIDIGDMMRSFCKTRENVFNEKRFLLMADEYRSFACPPHYSDGGMLTATKLITLELAARFLIDWFEDRYFQWDKEIFPDRKTSNLHRAQRYISYFETMK